MSSQTHVLILGGTGRVGQLVIAEALRRQYPVTALIRKEGGLEPRTNLTTIIGSPTSTSDISRALTSIQSANPSTNPQIIVISTLGQTRKSGNPWAATTSPAGFMAVSTQALIDALASSSERPNITKMIQLSMFGAKTSMANLNFLMRLIMAYSNMAQTVEDHNLVDDLIKTNFIPGSLDIPFVEVRPAMLKFGAAQDGQVKTHGDLGAGAGFMPSIQARDVARFLVDVVEDDRWDGKTPVISN